MITVRPGSHMYFLLKLLSVSGEFPSKSMGILGDVRTVKAMIHKMEDAQKIRLSTGGIIKTKLFQASGKWNDRTVRLNKKGLEVLNELHPNALGYYLDSLPDNRFSGNELTIDRNHRVGESIAMCMMAGIETAPYILPELQKDIIQYGISETPSYYVSRNLKKIFETELRKTAYTRITGLLFYPGGSYAVYNIRNAVMKINGYGEIKVRQELSEIVRMNAGLNDVTSALLFGVNGDVALQTLFESDKSRKKQDLFDNIYPSIHFIPLTHDGIDLLRILTLPNWHEKLMSVLFAADMRFNGHSSIEFDAYRDNKYYYSHLDSDIARLIRFNGALETHPQSFEILCFPWQMQFLKGYLCKPIPLKPIGMPKVLEALGII